MNGAFLFHTHITHCTWVFLCLENTPFGVVLSISPSGQLFFAVDVHSSVLMISPRGIFEHDFLFWMSECCTA